MDLQYKAELFSTSLKLQSAATGLRRMKDGRPYKTETKDFEWAGELVGQMDMESPHYRQRERPDACMIAEELRPLFYRTLLELRIPFDIKFSEELYDTLKSRGENVRINAEELGQASQLFQRMSNDVLTKLQHSSYRT